MTFGTGPISRQGLLSFGPAAGVEGRFQPQAAGGSRDLRRPDCRRFPVTAPVACASLAGTRKPEAMPRNCTSGRRRNVVPRLEPRRGKDEAFNRAQLVDR